MNMAFALCLSVAVGLLFGLIVYELVRLVKFTLFEDDEVNNNENKKDHI